jgi:hypothetical protein
MLVYNLDNGFINPDDLMKHLLGVQVLVYFNLKHYAMEHKDANNIRGNIFSAYATQVKIAGKVETLKSPYKSKILKGPITLLQSPAKHKEQMQGTSCQKLMGKKDKWMKMLNMILNQMR